MEREWLPLPRNLDADKREDSYANLLDILKLLEDERGKRFTDEQVNTIQKLVTRLIDQIRTERQNDKR